MTFLLVSLLTGYGFSQQCFDEIAAGAPPEFLAEDASAEDAAVYLQRAAQLLEPALPLLVGGADTHGLQPGDPAFEPVYYLASRRLLPWSWQPGELDLPLWQEMLASLARWYEVTVSLSHASGEVLTRQHLVSDLASLVAQVAPTLNPVVLVAASDDDRNRIGFLGIVRNDSIYPRLIVLRPPERSFDLSRGVQPILPDLATCAMPLRNFIFGGEAVATRLFLANNDSRMVIVEAGGDDALVPYYVERGEEISHLRFAHDVTESLDVFSAVFVGPGPSFLMIARLLPQFRTNMGPREIYRFVLQ